MSDEGPGVIVVEKREYGAVFKCGYCNKETPISDSECHRILGERKQLFDVCECGHKSYASSMKARFDSIPSDWKFKYGSLTNKEK